ncbi:MAG: SURF1 family protein [Candidatus Nanopelagicaceae bacterium]|nr:SURF1 family protein [Candidatus Nanopelagicaceae bacterium]
MMNQSKNHWLKNSGLVAAVVILALVFIRLGFWQLDRAAELKELQKPYVEKPVVALSDVASPSENLKDSAINRIVEFSGQYVAQFDAPGQIDNQEKVGTWLVGLLEVNGGGAILVVRSTQAEELPKGEIFVQGRLMLRQFEDRAAKSQDQLSRLDPSLLVATYNLPVYDGYVVANSELLNGKALELKRAQVDPVKPKVPGYYWQHISYVVIWWLMALVVVFLPFYSRQREKKVKGILN